MAAIPERGRLEERSLPRLLLDLHRARFSGGLELSRQRFAKRFLFQEGVPLFAESNLASERLVVQLLNRGQIRREDYERALAYATEQGCKDGKALLDLDLLDARGLFQALKEQVRARILECFSWQSGSFAVDPSCVPPSDAQPFRTDLYGLLQEGIEVHWDHERILSDLAPEMNRYPRRTVLFRRIEGRLAHDEAVDRLVEAIDGTRTLWLALQAATTRRALAAAWVLCLGGALAFRDASHSADRSSSDLEVDIVVTDSAPPAGDARGSPAPPKPAQKAGRPARADGAALASEIAERSAKLDESSHYELLGVEASADAAAIKRAYHHAAKTYHPDALKRVGLDGEILQQANRLFAAIGKAYGVLSHPARRADYDESQQGDAPSLDAERLANAETNYRKGEVLLRLGNFRGAVDYLRAAVETWPEESEYQAALGWALFKKTPSEATAAREHLEEATRLAAGNGEAWAQLAVVLAALGEQDAARAARARADAAGGPDR